MAIVAVSIIKLPVGNFLAHRRLMKIFITVKLRAGQEGVEKVSVANFIVRLHARPIEGQANRVLVRILARYFGVPQSRIGIISGAQSKKKTILIA